MKKLLISAIAALAQFAAVVALPLAAHAQVQQSGTVTAGHAARWVTSGVIGDAGAATSGSLTEIGLTKSGGVAIGVNSGPITGAYTQVGIGVTPGTGVQFTNTSLGGATHIPFNFVVNGATVFSITDTGVLINGSSAVGTVTSIATGTGLTGGPITSSGTISLAAIANNTVLGNNTGVSAAPTALNGTALSTLMGLGTASVKNATGSGASVASTSGSFTAGHIITAADANGTVQDGGTVPTGTITQVLAGTGLSGGGSTGSVTVSLASPVAVSNGGTGATTLTNHGVLVGQAGSAIVATSVGSAGQVLTSNGAGVDPTFQAVGGTGTVTSVATGAGLTGGTITTTGTIAFASVADLRILANITGGSAVPSANTLTAIIDAAIGSTRGSLLERGASGWALLAPGTINLPLVSGGAAADPAYAALGVAGGGTGNTSFSAHQLLVATGATTITGKTVPDCQDTSGQHLNYTQSTDTFACGTSGGVATPVSVANGGTGLSSGTSGGVPCYTGSTTIASSGALTANLPVIGGGAGACPSVGTRSGNTTSFATTTGTLTSGHVATFDASGNINDGGALPGSSGVVKIGSTQTASASAAIEFTSASYATAFDGTYNELLLLFDGVTFSGGSQTMRFQVGTGGGPTYNTGSSYLEQGHYDAAGAPTAISSTNSTYMKVDGGAVTLTTASMASGEIRLRNPSSSSTHKLVAIRTTIDNGGAGVNVDNMGDWAADNTALTALKIFTTAGSFATGNFTLYGYAK